MLKTKKLVLIFAAFLAISTALVYQSTQNNDIYAVNPLEVTYNDDAPPDPMFEITNMLPGDEEEKEFNVKNASPDSLSVEMVANKTDEGKSFAEILDIEITDLESSSIIFSGKLHDLFNSPSIALGNFPPDANKNFRVKVKFPELAGNDYQNAFVVFNIVWRTTLPPIEIPEECRHLAHVISNVIEGTNKSDHIYGTHASELILSYEKNDKIDGGAGNDCIVANSGNNRVDGGAGMDIIIAGDGNNRVEGGAGNDKIYLGSGNDRADGGAGNDEIYGGAGNDRLKGGAGQDFLDGGAGHDRLDGDAGVDTCINGEILSSCEI